MNAVIDSNNLLHIGKETYWPWPWFKIKGASLLDRLHNPIYLREILCEQDLFSATWRSFIPVRVQRELSKYPMAQAELLETAQLDVDGFVQLSQTNPALTLIISAYWVFAGSDPMPHRRKRDRVRRRLLTLKRRQVLSELGLPATNEMARVLGKIPASLCYDFHARRVLEHAQTPTIRRLLRHLNPINLEVSLLLCQPDPILDISILNLAASLDESSGMRVNEFARKIQFNREAAGLFPVWPYRGQIRTWEALLQAEHRVAKRTDCQPEMLPRPPVGVNFLPDGLVLEPLQTRSELREEGRIMGNCCAEFEDEVYALDAYIYRMKAPERATVLLRRIGGFWCIDEAMLPNNSDSVSTHSMALLVRWLEQK